MTAARVQNKTGTFFRVHPSHPFFGQELVALHEMTEEVNDWLDSGGNGWPVDEVALIMDGRTTAGPVLSSMVSNQGVEYFNNAVDTVTAWPFGCRYRPEYHFLRTPYPWRIELLRLPDGGSPVHVPYATQENTAKSGLMLVHFSFKCADEDEYNEAVGWLAGRANLAQSCESTYGRFGYWRTPLFGDLMAYVKPRINLRDKPGKTKMWSRIDHSGHDHPSTPQDRRVCRDALRREAGLAVPHEPPPYPRNSLHWDSEGYTEQGLEEYTEGKIQSLKEGGL